MLPMVSKEPSKEFFKAMTSWTTAGEGLVAASSVLGLRDGLGIVAVGWGNGP